MSFHMTIYWLPFIKSTDIFMLISLTKRWHSHGHDFILFESLKDFLVLFIIGNWFRTPLITVFILYLGYLFVSNMRKDWIEIWMRKLGNRYLLSFWHRVIKWFTLIYHSIICRVIGSSVYLFHIQILLLNGLLFAITSIWLLIN
jgi:hypothetical protein